jgi:hypothetical protein
LLDGGYVIPYEGAHPLADALTRRLATWLTLPNGRYTVTTHVLHEDLILHEVALPDQLGDEILAGYLVVTLQRQ